MYYDEKSEKRKKLEESMRNMTKEEKRSSLRAQFWSDKQQIDKNTPFMKKIEELCKDIDFGEKKSQEEIDRLRGKI